MVDSKLSLPLTGCVILGKSLMSLVLIPKMRYTYFTKSLADEMK